MLKDFCKITLAAFAILLFAACGILTLVLPDSEFSEEENRSLKQKPELTLKSVVKSDYQKELEDYLSDQVVCRTDFMKLYALAEIAECRTDYNGVYVCDDDWLIEVYKKPENTYVNAERFRKISDNLDADCTLMLIPTAVSMYSEKLPSFTSKNNKQKEVMKYMYANSGMQTVDVWDTLEDAKKDTRLYYKTDHHWTTDAAYICYEKFCEAKGLTAVPKESFDIEEVSNRFYGTVYSKALTPFQPYDTIKAYKQDMSGITVTYASGEGSLYNDEYLQKKDKYSYFLNGIQSEITITNDNIKEGKTLLVVKDSYANCFVPFLINHYSKIVVLDTRYYRLGVSTAAANSGADEVLFLFNLNTFDTDTALAGIF